MKRFSRRWFSQIMINKLIKRELDSLKQSMMLENNINFKLSYGDVIKILIDNYKKKKVEYNVEQKLKISFPLKQEVPLSVVYKLD